PSADARPGSWVRLSVADTGVGIPADVLPHIFDPFYTTRPTGQSRGMGLAMVHGIIKQHRGWVECHSEGSGRGTRFDLYLPRWEEVQSRPSPAARSQGPPTVLLVEDNDLLRHLAETYLRQNGFRVVTAADAREASALLAQQRPDLRIALVGVSLP